MSSVGMGLMSYSTHIGHFEDEYFQATNCIGTGNQKQRNKILHSSKTQKKIKNKKLLR